MELVERIFKGMGVTVKVRKEFLDAVTALSGQGLISCIGSTGQTEPLVDGFLHSRGSPVPAWFTGVAGAASGWISSGVTAMIEIVDGYGERWC